MESSNAIAIAKMGAVFPRNSITGAPDRRALMLAYFAPDIGLDAHAVWQVDSQHPVQPALSVTALPDVFSISNTQANPRRSSGAKTVERALTPADPALNLGIQ